MTRRTRRHTLEILAPMAGTVVRLEDVPDPVFAGQVVGIGLAILPEEPTVERHGTDRAVVVAPCDGIVVSVYPHAVVIRVDEERSVLVHLGLGTAGRHSACFDPAVVDGDRVAAGRPIIGWSPARVRAADLPTLSPLVALQSARDDVALLVPPGREITEGQALLLWS